MPRWPPVLDRFMEKVVVNDDTDCWEWQGRRNPEGYGRMSVGNREWNVHQVSWALFIGELPETVDHRCRVRHCVNPDHLRSATRQQQAWNRRFRNATGFMGVTKITGSARYQARIFLDGHFVYLGSFDTAEEAHQAYSDAARAAYDEFYCETMPGRATVQLRERDHA